MQVWELATLSSERPQRRPLWASPPPVTLPPACAFLAPLLRAPQLQALVTTSRPGSSPEMGP